ncbi:MAG: SWIM zinc finger family protein [Candidatus Promineifilaceae bacterium]
MTINTLREAIIRSRVGEKSFSRGKQYYEEGAIISPWMQGDILKAKCWGSSPHPYRLWVRLGPDGIEGGECSCPVGSGGYCKHVAALLLTWLHESESFQEVEPLENGLGKRDKADLILLIQKMIARYPDLEEMVYVTPAGTASATTSVNPDLIRRQVEQAIKHGDYGHDYGAAAGITDELETIMQQANPYRERDDWLNAAVIYSTVLERLLWQYDNIYDHDGDLSAVFWEGSERLGECLEEIQQPEKRLEILRVLVAIIVKDISVGGYGFADTAYDIVLTQSEPGEKAEIVVWVEDELARLVSSLDDFSKKWRAGAFGRLLLNLQEDSLTDEQFIGLCRRTGQLNALVERLMQLGRVDEAVSDTQPASDYELLALADIFVAHGHNKVAEELIEERAQASKDTRLNNWLKIQAINNGDWRKAVEYAEMKFWQRSTLEDYQEIKDIAGKLGDWSERKEAILSRLTQKEDYALLTQIYLLEEEMDAALTTLPKVRYARGLAMEVARAAEVTHPREAIQLYRQQIERLIAARGRSNYAEAADYLIRVRKLYQRLSETDTWLGYIGAIRDQKPRLPALLDELKQAGL